MSDDEDPVPTGGNDTLTAVTGVSVGHWSDARARTGCTVVYLGPQGMVASGAVLGAAPGTREVALLAPEKTVQCAHAFVLTGGSAFGLASAHGVMRVLEGRGVGVAAPAGPVPIVPAAAIYDLAVGDPTVRPGEAEGAYALEHATDAPVALGAVGVGCGASVGKLLGIERAVASGLGSAVRSVRGALVGALAVSNALGSLVDPSDGRLVAGHGDADPEDVADHLGCVAHTNTTLVAIVTDASIDKAGAQALAYAAHAGIARVTFPSHTAADGDVAFVATSGRGPSVALTALGVAVQAVVAEALLRGARAVAA